MVKRQDLADETELFGEEVRITKEGQRHLGKLLNSRNIKTNIVVEKSRGGGKTSSCWRKSQRINPTMPTLPSQRVANWNLHILCAELTLEDYVEPADEAINDIFVPVLFGQTARLPEELRELFTRPPAQEGLGIPDMKAEAPQQYAASKLIIAPHEAAICTRSTFMPVGEQTVEDLKRQQHSLKTTAATMRREAIDASLTPDLLRATMQARDKGASSWLNAVTLEEQDLILNKQQFRDALRFHYNLPLADVPSYCACVDRFTFSHSLSCKKGGFAAQRHDGIRNLLTSLLSKVCKDVEVESHLLPIDNEVFDLRSTVTNPEARLDMEVRKKHRHWHYWELITAQQLTWCQSQGVPCRPDILIGTRSDSPTENVLTLCRVSRLLLLLISGGEGHSLIWPIQGCVTRQGMVCAKSGF